MDRIKRMSKIVAMIIFFLTIGTNILLADSHGNNFVHSRTSGGQVFIMYENHMSLYTYDDDSLGVSTCYNACAQSWPPAVFEPGTILGENYSLIERSDGSLQAAFKGQPLYLSILDDKIGETNGDGAENGWFLARPEF